VFESDEPRCFRCGKRKLKPVAENDPVYLTSLWNNPLSGMLEDSLTRNGIPFMRRETPGSVPMAVFAVAFSFDYYVPFGALDKAKELAELVPKQSGGQLPVLPI